MHDCKNLCGNIVRLLIGNVTNYSWNRDVRHREHCKTLGVFEPTWPENSCALPWRLTRAQRNLLEQRTANIKWIHYIEPLYYRGASFWTKPSRMWKSRRKYRLLLYVLPVLLRDQVPRLREAILLMAIALRRLDGQVHSYEAAKSLGIMPGLRSLKKTDIDDINGDLIRAFVLLEGCVPISYLIPIMHHFVHYGAYAKTHGILRHYWMMTFER